MSDYARILKSDSEEAFELGSRISQIFCGVAFTALSLYLITSNTTRMSYIHRASIEKRLAVCCQLSLIVAALSAFLNFFQLTELDNWALPGQRQFTVDVSRPIEWILTCPVMQLSLVIMGGPRIPENRRVIMPLSSVIVLLFGTSTLFLDKPYIFICYACAFMTHCGAMYLNRQQIIEHSRGVEGLFTGDSEFRRATLILILTWFPFPMWFFLSPEGVGLVDNITIVQLGWAFLNIISKFTLIFYIQRIKDNYNIRVKVKRTMQQQRGGGREFGRENTAYDDVTQTTEASNELGALVLETMSFLGMAQNAERLLKLLQQARVVTLEQLALLDRVECEEKQLPYDLICAIQNRYKVWALEMVDDAEIGLEAGEKFYNIGPEINDKGAVTGKIDITQEPVVDVGKGECKITFPKGLNNESRQIPGLMITPRDGETASKEAITPRRRSANVWGHQVAFESQGENQTAFQDMLMDTMTKAMEQFESKLWEKFEYALEGTGRRVMERIDKAVEGVGRHVSDCDTTLRFGLQDVSKSMERSQALLESKVEYVFASQGSQQNDELQVNMKTQFEELSQKTLDSAAQREHKLMSTMSSRFESIEAGVKAMSQSLNQLQELQQSGVARLGGSLTELTEGCAHQVIQESKAAAYTLQAKLEILGESQKKASAESEVRLTKEMQQFKNEVSDKMKEALTPPCSTPPTMRSLPDHHNMERQAFVDPAASGRTLEALGSLERNLTDMIKGLSSEQSKQLELGLGVFGAALRSQLDSLKQEQAGQQKETEAKIESKLDRMHEQGRKQTDKIITQITLQQASGLQAPVSSFNRPASMGSGGRRHTNPWNDA